jgi:hypothetical protein
MGGKSMSKLIYEKLESLNAVKKVLKEAEYGIKDDSRCQTSKEISELFAAAGGLTVGAGIGFAGLYFGGTVGLSAAGITSGLAAAGGIVGGGMLVGIGVLAAPAAVLAAGAGYIVSCRNKAKLRQAKELLLQDAIKKHDAIIKQLEKKVNLAADRIDYLTKMNILLQGIINDLQTDLAA